MSRQDIVITPANIVTPAKAGVQAGGIETARLDSRVRGNDGIKARILLNGR